MKRFLHALFTLLLALLCAVAPAQGQVLSSLDDLAGSWDRALDAPAPDKTVLPWAQPRGPPVRLAGLNIDGNVRDPFTGFLFVSSVPPPTFVLPLNDLGSGAVKTVPAFAAGSPTATFTRATTADTHKTFSLPSSSSTPS